MTEESPEVNTAATEEKQVNECPYGAGGTPKQEISANVDKTLKLFSGYEKLHVDEQGSAYTVGTKLPAGKEIPLYTNPYYKL